MRPILLVLLLVSLILPACTSAFSPRYHANPAIPWALAGDEPQADSDGPAKEAKSGRSFLVGALLYLPNRILDVFDLVRFGVDVGPGVGGQLKATDPLQVAAIFRFSAGVGFQGFRHLPIQLSAEAGAAVGPIAAVADPGLVWYQSPTDIRIFAHVLLVGVHVAIDPVEWLDLPAGFILLDPANDDL